MRLKSYIDSEINIFNVLLTLEMIDTCHQNNRLDESVVNTVKGAIDKVKAFLQNSVKSDFWKMVEKDKNLGQHLYSFSIDGARLLYHAFNAYYNKDDESKKYIKELSKTVGNTEFRNILLKLDVMTLSMFTGPIEIIDVLTGWKLYDALKKKLKPLDDKAREAIKMIELIKHDLENPAFKIQAQKYSNALRRVFSLGGYKKIDEKDMSINKHILLEETVGADIAEPDIKIGDPVRRRLKRQKKVKDGEELGPKDKKKKK